jgi:hypothetical protein
MEEDDAMEEARDDEAPRRRRLRLRVPRLRLSALGSRAIWDDRLVLALVAVAIACLAFAAGRFSVDEGPASVQEAMQMAQAGELPFSTDGDAGDGAAGGQRGGGFGGPPSGGAAGPAGRGADSR